MRSSKLIAATLALVVSGVSVEAFALNVRKEMKKQDCFKCHAISREKDGPSIKDIAAKYKDEENPFEALRTHLTSSPEIEVDGKKEKHKQFEADSEEDLKEVIDWILSN
ncbi:c-type cytochrome [Motiliproteus sp. SC1-56]|uniref:c-type cytochrome n=1 Tax=Motiliproteus sp. SC1-56 TaxID=2799565 RepID=UPI001A90950E|nr:c-type cytochrome [Motiliproteus sp. SC1-56]